MPIRIPSKVGEILAKLRSGGFEAFLVGGCVRDALLGIPCDDYDVATNARPGDIKRIFPKSRAVGQAFGVMLVNGVEVSTFRNDGAYLDHRHPDSVTYADTIEDDLSRRDFTVNAMAYDGENIIDPYGGQKDLESKVIRFVGSARKRMREDPLRALRACRFAAKIDGMITPSSAKAIKDLSHLVDFVSMERRQQELSKMLTGPRPEKALDLAARLGLLPYLILDLVPSIGCAQPPHHKEDCWEHALLTLKNARKKDLSFRLACLLHDIAKPLAKAETKDGSCTFYKHEVLGEKMVRKALKDLKYSNEIIDTVAEYTKYHMRPLLFDSHMKDPALQRLIGSLKHISFRDLIRLMLCDLRGNACHTDKPFSYIFKITRPIMERYYRIMKEHRVLKLRDLPVTGEDIMRELKIAPGPAVGKMLQKLYAFALKKPKSATREKLLSEARRIAEAEK